MLIPTGYLTKFTYATDMSKRQVAGLHSFLRKNNGFLGLANHFYRPIGPKTEMNVFEGALSMFAIVGGAGAFSSVFYKHHFLAKAVKVSLFDW